VPIVLPAAEEPAHGVLSLVHHLADLIRGLSRDVLRLTGDLAGRVLRLICRPAQRAFVPLLVAVLFLVLLLIAGQTANSILYSLRDLACLVGDLSGGFLGLIRHLAGLIGYLASRALGLLGGLPRDLLRLLGCHVGRVLPRGCVRVLPGLLGRLLQRVLHTRVLGGLAYGLLEPRVGFGHLLGLGLRIAGELLHVVLELAAVALHLAEDAPHRLPEELAGLLKALVLLRLLLTAPLLVLYLAH